MNDICPITQELNITINIIYPQQKSNKMDNEKLLKAQKLANKIEELEKDLKIWEASTSLYYREIALQQSAIFGNYKNIQSVYVNFDILKAVTIAELNKQLKDAKSEFEAL